LIAITDSSQQLNIGLLMILKWGEATANKISFGDCEAKRDPGGANPRCANVSDAGFERGSMKVLSAP
jgi:hypothetical protein